MHGVAPYRLEFMDSSCSALTVREGVLRHGLRPARSDLHGEGW